MFPGPSRRLQLGLGSGHSGTTAPCTLATLGVRSQMSEGSGREEIRTWNKQPRAGAESSTL